MDVLKSITPSSVPDLAAQGDLTALQRALHQPLMLELFLTDPQRRPDTLGRTTRYRALL